MPYHPQELIDEIAADIETIMNELSTEGRRTKIYNHIGFNNELNTDIGDEFGILYCQGLFHSEKATISKMNSDDSTLSDATTCMEDQPSSLA